MQVILIARNETIITCLHIIEWVAHHSRVLLLRIRGLLVMLSRGVTELLLLLSNHIFVKLVDRIDLVERLVGAMAHMILTMHCLRLH